MAISIDNEKVLSGSRAPFVAFFVSFLCVGRQQVEHTLAPRSSACARVRERIDIITVEQLHVFCFVSFLPFFLSCFYFYFFVPFVTRRIITLLGSVGQSLR